MLEPQALLDKPPKSNIRLSKDELTRQAHIIDSLLDKGHTATALSLMREWTVSWVIYRRILVPSGSNHNAVRRQAENLLHSICVLERDNLGCTNPKTEKAGEVLA